MPSDKKREYLATVTRELEYLRNEAALIPGEDLAVLTFLIDQALVEARALQRKTLDS